MKNTFAVFFMLCFCLQGLPLLADTTPYFQHIDTRGSSVSGICKDRSGTIWLATSTGLKNYGELMSRRPSFETYLQALDVHTESVQCDGEGKLWLRTVLRSMVVYDPKTNEVIEDVEALLQSWGIRVWYDFDLLIDRQYRFWIYKDGTLYCYERPDNRLRSFNAPDGKILSLTIGQKEAYFCTADSLYALDIASFACHTRTKLPFQFTGKIVLHEDTGGNLWLGHNNILLRYIATGNHWDICADKLKSDIMGILSQPDGTVCVGTNGDGLWLFNADGKLNRILRYDPFHKGGLYNDHLGAIYCDDMGNLWITYTKQGMSVYNPQYQDYYMQHLASLLHRNIPDDILSFYTDPGGKLWIGTDGNGAYCVDSKRGTEEQLEGLEEAAVVSMFMDSKSRQWVGVYRHGLICIENGKRTRYFEGLSPYCIIEDAKGYIYVAILGQGLHRIQPESGEAQKIYLGGEWVMEMVCGQEQKIYIAATDGLHILDTGIQQIETLLGNRAGTQSFSNEDLAAVAYDSRGWVWVLCNRRQGVVNIFDLKNDTIITLPQLKDYNIKSFVEDDRGDMWLASDQGIVQITVRTNRVTGKHVLHTYYYQNDNSHESVYYNFRAAKKLPDGRLIFGSTNGYQVINPVILSSLMSRKQEYSPIKFTSLRVNDSPVMAGKPYNGRILLNENITYVRKLDLEYYENNISLELYPQDYGVPFKRNYYYWLDNWSTEWMSVNDYTVMLANLPPKSYKLFIREQDITGELSGNLAELEIIIRPPMWKSTIAYICYAILFAVLLTILFYYWYNKQKYKLRLKQMEMEAERQFQMNEMKLRFFTNISHDFRTPLSLIITPLEDYLSHAEDHDRMKIFLEPVHRNAVRLLNLVNQVLDFRKLEVYGGTLNLSYGDIISFMKEVCSSFAVLADDSHLMLSFHSSVEKLEMSFDKDKVTKIMMNLLSNAFKFTSSEGSVHVSIEVWNTELQVKVADTGRGIPDADKQRIFERFYQSSGQNTIGMGCGIGLHIVKEFVELHKGKITVMDNQPQGAVFLFTLPILKDEKKAISLTAAKEDLQEEETIMDENKRSDAAFLLLVEDNPDFLAYMSKTLSDKYRILQAHHGKEALEILKNNSVDIIISDVMMSEMDGLVLCKTVKNNIETSHIPIILLTAKVLEEDELKGLEMGADDYITKPFNLSILRHRIQKLLDRNLHSHERFKKEIEINPSEITITPLDEKLIADAIRIVEENMENSGFSVDMLSSQLGMHRTSLYKKLLFVTGKTPIEFIRLLRLKRAMQLLGKSQLYVSEISYKVGFNSPKIFAKYFREEFGMSPREYLKSLNIREHE